MGIPLTLKKFQPTILLTHALYLLPTYYVLQLDSGAALDVLIAVSGLHVACLAVYQNHTRSELLCRLFPALDTSAETPREKQPDDAEAAKREASVKDE